MFVELIIPTENGPVSVYSFKNGNKKDFIVINNYKYVFIFLALFYFDYT